MLLLRNIFKQWCRTKNASHCYIYLWDMYYYKDDSSRQPKTKKSFGRTEAEGHDALNIDYIYTYHKECEPLRMR